MSTESSIYLSMGCDKFIQELFVILKLQNFINVFAGVVLPNNRNEGFHENLGFQEVGIFKKGIYKLENWPDVKWFKLSLSEHVNNPPLPKSVNEVMQTLEFITILRQANEN